MLRTTAVSTTTAAVWLLPLLALLGAGLSLAAADGLQPDFSLCSRCFYRQTPPRVALAGSLLRPSCHTLPGGLAFARLSKPDCDTAVYSALRLGRGETERGGQEGEEPVVRMQLSCLFRLALSFEGRSVNHWPKEGSTFTSKKPKCLKRENNKRKSIIIF